MALTTNQHVRNKVRAMGKKTKPSNARAYEDGFLSRAQVAKACGETGFGAWAHVQRALVSGKFMSHKNEILERGEGVVRLHDEFNDKTGDLKQWPVLHPSMVEVLKPIIAKNKADAEAGPVKPGDGENEYPEGFVALSTLARQAGIAPLRLRTWLIDNGTAKQTSKGFEPVDPADPAAFKYERENARGKVESWYVWSVPELLSTLLSDIKRNPDSFA